VSISVDKYYAVWDNYAVYLRMTMSCSWLSFSVHGSRHSRQQGWHTDPPGIPSVQLGRSCQGVSLHCCEGHRQRHAKRQRVRCCGLGYPISASSCSCGCVQVGPWRGIFFFKLLVCRQGEVVVIREQRKIDSGRAVEGTGLQGG
jgi:hypothetical protein